MHRQLAWANGDSMRSAFALLILVAVVLSILPACPQKEPADFKGEDLVMVQQATLICDAINTYHRDTVEWPETIQEAAGSLPAGAEWPSNPYNQQPIADTGSPDFDPQTSVGMVYYQKFYRDDRIMNYQLHVFGQKGTLYIFGNSAFGPRK
jgi:hypothetical protein